jgi:hypothetical protein
MDLSTTSGESKDDIKCTPPPSPASGGREKSRNLTSNVTTMTNHVEKVVSAMD